MPFIVMLGGFLLFLLTSCNALFLDEQKPNNAQNNFDLLWKIIDERYCFFEEKDVNWNLMYDQYSSELKDRFMDATSPRLFDLMGQMLEELRDGHVVLDDGFSSRTFSGWYNSYPDNFNSSLVNIYKNNDKNLSHLENNTDRKSVV